MGVGGPFKSRKEYLALQYFLFFFTEKYSHSYRFYLSGSVNKFLNFCVAHFPCWFQKNGHNTFSQPFSSCCICVNSGFPNFSSNYICHIDFPWNKVVRVDSTGPTNGTRSEKAWDPLVYGKWNVASTRERDFTWQMVWWCRTIAHLFPP